MWLIFVPTTQRYYLAIDAKWFSKYVGDKLEKVYDCYIAQLSKDHNHLDKIHHLCDVSNIDNDNGSSVGSMDFGNVSLDHAIPCDY